MLLATELIDYRFEGYDQALIDTNLNNVERHCGTDENIEYRKEDIVDFYIDFVQHYEHVRLHWNHIQLQNIKHENEGYYECIIRLTNGLVGVRVFFLSGKNINFTQLSNRIDSLLVGGHPRQISNRERQIYAEVNDSITLLCPIFSTVPAWYTFLVPKGSHLDMSSLSGHDYLRMKQVSYAHDGTYICRVTTTDSEQGFSLMSDVYLNVYGKLHELSRLTFI